MAENAKPKTPPEDHAKRVPPGHVENLNTLIRAAINGQLAAVACKDRTTGKTVTLACAIRAHGEAVDMTPLALLLPLDAEDQNPYERFIPPGAPGNE